MPTDYSTMTVAALRDLCRARGLRVSGPAANLIAQLEADDANRAAREAEGRIRTAAVAPASVDAARETELRLGWLATNAGATWHAAQRRVEEAARRLVAARDLGLDDGTQVEVLRRELAALDEAAAAYLKAARRALAVG